MSDCISRQAAIDAINHELKCGAVIDQCGLETAHGLIEELPPAQPERKWIPCSERLPEAKQRVLVTFPDGTVDIKICIDAGHLKWFFAHMIAWMPLPEPYNGVER